MVTVGTIEYEAKVVGADEAREKTTGLQQSQEELAAASEQSADEVNNFSGTVEASGDASGRTAQQVGVLDNSTRLLRSTIVGAVGAIGGIILKLTGLGAIAGTVAGGVKAIAGVIGGLTLSGVLGSVTGAIGSFVGWLAGASAGALSFAAALGVGIGTLGVFALEQLGVLDAVQRFGAYVSNKLPPSVRDAFVSLIGFVLSPLATIGAGIVGFVRGTIEGGLQEGIDRAVTNIKKTFGIFAGAWQRTKDRIVGIIGTIVGKFKSLKNKTTQLFKDLGNAIVGTVKGAFNTAIPSEISIPEVGISLPEKVGGGSVAVGGQSIDLPQLQTGGIIEQTGVAVVDRGEAVIPEPIVSGAAGATGGAGGGGSGGSSVRVDNMNITINGDFDPSDLSRRDAEDLANRVKDALGKQTFDIQGTR